MLRRGPSTIAFFPDPVTVPAIRGGQVEKYGEGDRITCTVAAAQASTGGKMQHLVTGQDRQVGDAGDLDARVLGVAIHDGAAGEKVVVATEGVWLLKANGAIQAGDRVVCAAAGDVKVAPAIAGAYAQVDGQNTRAIVGVALADIANAQLGPILLDLV